MKMKFLLVLVSFTLCNVLSGQIKIGDNPQNIDASSVLELESSNRVFVVTRINTSQMNSIVPSQGAIVYNTDELCLYFYDGASWLNMCETFGLTFTADPIVNPTSTIVITETGDNRNFEVGEITGANIVDFSISGIDIQNNSITSDKLAPDSVGSEELQTNTVADDEIDYNQVTLNDFNNDAGFITGAQIVSPDPNNSITDNGGAFYDNTPVLTDIAANAAAIAADGDRDDQNELQDLTQVLATGNSANDKIINLTNPTDPQDAATKIYVDNAITGSTQTIVSGDLPNSISTGSDGGALFNATPLQNDIDANTAELLLKENLANKSTDINLGTSDVLYPSQNAVKTYVDSQVGGSAQSIGEVLTVGNDAGANSIINLVDSTDPTSAATRSYVDSQVSNGSIISNNLSITGGTNALFGNVTIDIPDDAINAAMLNTDVAGAGLLQNPTSGALEIEPGTNGQFLSTNAAGNIVWTVLPVTGGNQTLSEVLALGNDAGTLKIVNLLDPDDPQDAATKAYVDSSIGASGSTELADQITIIGDGALGNEFEVADGSINSTKITDLDIAAIDIAPGAIITAKILDANVTPIKIEPSTTNGQFLTTDAGGNVAWADLPAGGNPAAADVTFIPTGNTASGDVQAAIEELQTEIDGISSGGAANPNDELITSFTLTGTDLNIAEGANIVPPVDLDPVFATDAELAALNVDDADADPGNEIQAIASADGSVIVTPVGVNDFDLSVPLGSDDQNLTSAVLAGTDLTIAIEEGTAAIADLSALATDAELAALNVDDADADPVNEIQNITSGDGSVTVTPAGIGFDLSVAAGSDDQNLASAVLAGSNLTIAIEDGNPAVADLSALATDAELAALPIDDADADPVNEIQNITSGDGSVTVTPAGIGFDLSVAAGSDDQNLTSAVFAGTDLTIAIEDGNPVIADLSALATDAELAALPIDDADADPVNEIQNITSGDGSVTVTPAGIGFDLSVPAGSDNQNIQGSGLAVETLTIGIENGTSQDISLAPFALETELAAAIAASEAADGDTDDTNEIQIITSTDGSVTLVQTGDDYDLSVAGGSTDDQNLTSAVLAGSNLTIAIEDGNPAIADLSSLATDLELAALSVDDADADPVNEIQTITSTDGSVTLLQTGDDYDLSVATGGNNLSNSNLIQTGGNRTYNINNQDLAFLNGDIGIGTPAPSATLHVAGSLRLNDEFIDGDSDAGNPGQILSSTGTATDWIDPPAGAVSTGTTITGDGTPGNVLDVADGGISAAKIAVGAVSGGPGGVIATNSITQGDIGDNAIGSAELQADSVGESELEPNAVTTTEIQNLTIQNEDINSTAAIDGSKINPNFNLDIVTTGGLSVGADILLNGNVVIPDYVFQKYFSDYSNIKKSYNFWSLDEIEAYVKKNHHLPGIKSAKEVQEDGFWNLSESNLQNLEKIEELFLHTINQEKKINQLETKNQAILEELNTLKEELQAIKNLLKED